MDTAPCLAEGGRHVLTVRRINLLAAASGNAILRLAFQSRRIQNLRATCRSGIMDSSPLRSRAQNDKLQEDMPEACPYRDGVGIRPAAPVTAPRHAHKPWRPGCRLVLLDASPLGSKAQHDRVMRLSLWAKRRVQNATSPFVSFVYLRGQKTPDRSPARHRAPGASRPTPWRKQSAVFVLVVTFFGRK